LGIGEAAFDHLCQWLDPMASVAPYTRIFFSFRAGSMITLLVGLVSFVVYRSDARPARAGWSSFRSVRKELGRLDRHSTDNRARTDTARMCRAIADTPDADSHAILLSGQPIQIGERRDKRVPHPPTGIALP